MSEANILIIPEIRKGELDGTTSGLIAKGRELADKINAKVHLLLIGYGLENLIDSVNNAGADRVLFADQPILKYYNPEIYCNLICDILKDLNPRFIILGYTYWGMELGPAISERYNAYLISNCVELEIDGELLRAVRPMFAGAYQVKIEVKTGRPYVVSFQRGGLPKKMATQKTSELSRLNFEIEEASLRSKVLEIVEPSEGEVDITKAEIIVAVGRGITDQANIPIIKELADALGGCIACSRPVADLGWLPKEYHVGISGKTVSPKVYIACGISGSSQHVAGMEDSKMIIAINKDPKAPIFNISDFGVVGDIFKIVPELTSHARSSQK